MNIDKEEAIQILEKIKNEGKFFMTHRIGQLRHKNYIIECSSPFDIVVYLYGTRNYQIEFRINHSRFNYEPSTIKKSFLKIIKYKGINHEDEVLLKYFEIFEYAEQKRSEYEDRNNKKTLNEFLNQENTLFPS